MALRNYIIQPCAISVLLVFCSCDTIYNGEQLSTKELTQIKNIGLLDSGEKIYQFYSNNGLKSAGNFYTSKRIAHYWIYKEDKQIDSAYYRDIARLHLTPHPPGDFTIPYITVIKKDSSQFKVYINGDESEISNFFSNCRAQWKANQ